MVSQILGGERIRRYLVKSNFIFLLPRGRIARRAEVHLRRPVPVRCRSMRPWANPRSARSRRSSGGPEAGLRGGDIGAIQIADGFSLVEVPEVAAEHVIQTLRGATIGG